MEVGHESVEAAVGAEDVVENAVDVVAPVEVAPVVEAAAEVKSVALMA